MKWQDIKWPVTFALACTAIAAAILAGLWLTGVFGDLGLSLHGSIALFIGVTLTVFVGVGLMTLVFYSDRSDRDNLAQSDSPPKPHDP